MNHTGNESRFNKEDLFKAADEMGMTIPQKEELWRLLHAKTSQTKRFNLLNVIYYLGALIVFYALITFASEGYSTYGVYGLFFISIAYAIFFCSIGIYFWKVKQWHVVGGLSLFLSLSLVPLITYAGQDIIGWWPGDCPGDYPDFYAFIRGGWLMMELSTIVVVLVAMYFIRFPFLTVILYVTLWFMSMDIVPFLMMYTGMQLESLDELIAIVFGLCIIGIALWIDRKTKEDFAFWAYLIGVLSFWLGITMIDYTTEWEYFGYCVVNVFMVLLGPILKRLVFVIFGAMGVISYLGMLAYRCFATSSLFPLGLSIVGLGVIALGLALQRYRSKHLSGSS